MTLNELSQQVPIAIESIQPLVDEVGEFIKKHYHAFLHLLKLEGK